MVMLSVSVIRVLSLVTEVSVVSYVSEVITAVEKLCTELSEASAGGGAVSAGRGVVSDTVSDIPKALWYALLRSVREYAKGRSAAIRISVLRVVSDKE